MKESKSIRRKRLAADEDDAKRRAGVKAVLMQKSMKQRRYKMNERDGLQLNKVEDVRGISVTVRTREDERGACG